MGTDEIEIKTNKYIDFSINLEKVCYFPGEKINGNLILSGKPGLNETQLNNPKALFTIKQLQRYTYSDGEHSHVEKLDTILFEEELVFNSFIGANLLITIHIPFSVNLPIYSYPSCSFSDGGYVKHNFSVEFLHLNIKRTIKIVVKNYPYFTLQNELLKIPCSLFWQISKSNFLVNKGNFILLVNLPKNVFYYDEPIPFEIKLNRENLDLKINSMTVALCRHRKKNYSSNCDKTRLSKFEEFIWKYYEI